MELLENFIFKDNRYYFYNIILRKYKYYLSPRIKIFSSLIFFIFKIINNKYLNNIKRFNKKITK